MVLERDLIRVRRNRNEPCWVPSIIEVFGLARGLVQEIKEDGRGEGKKIYHVNKHIKRDKKLKYCFTLNTAYLNFRTWTMERTEGNRIYVYLKSWLRSVLCIRSRSPPTQNLQGCELTCIIKSEKIGPKSGV